MLCFSKITVFSVESFLMTFLENYFETENITCSTYRINGKEMYFAYRKNGPRTFNKAISFYYEEGMHTIRPILYITANKVIDNSGKLLFKGVILTQEFWGWSVVISDKTGSFSTSFYTNGGINVTDGPTFVWDSSQNTYKEFVVENDDWR
jgi:hypothetical protein